ncbi:MAG: hypothetical protein IPL32_18975 [Chloracidobacterium sp.]|nr:hypothetical protein [Chloracidobacterium sp.]
MPRITLDAALWFRGASTSDNLADGGFSPDDKGVSLFITEGVLKPGPRDLGVGSIFDANGVIAWNVAKTLLSTEYGYALTANASNDGEVMALNTGGAASHTSKYGPDTGRDYKAGISDVISYKSGIIWTSTADIALAGDYDWWTATLSLGALASSNEVTHRMLIYGDILYIADGRYIHSWDGTTGTYNALDLPADYNITDFCVSNNVIVISAEYFSSNTSGDRYGKSKIFTWDGFSPSWIDETDIFEHIDCLFPFGGTLYVTTKDYFGYFNGSAIAPLRKLTSQVRRHQITGFKDRIMMIQGDSILCYGNPIPGRQRFFSYPWKHEDGTLSSIFSFYSTQLLASRGTTSIVISNFDTTSDGSDFVRYFKENRIPLGDYAYIKKFTFELDAAVASGDTLDIYYLNSNGDTNTVGSINNTDHNGRREIVLDVENDFPTYTVQPRYKWTDGSIGIRRVHIDYEFSEDRPTK